MKEREPRITNDELRDQASTDGAGACNEPWRPNSQLLDFRNRIQAQLDAEPRRPLVPREITQLQSQGNSSADWSRVRVSEGFTTGAVHSSRFEGDVLLGSFTGASSTERPGIYFSSLCDCVIGSNCRIAHSNIARYTVGAGAVIENVDRLLLVGERSAFGNDLELFREELFARPLRVVAEMPFEEATRITGAGSIVSKKSNDSLAAFAEQLAAPRGFISPGVRIRSVPLIENCWIGENVAIEAGGAVRNCTIWGSREEPTLLRDGAIVRNSLIGPGCLLENVCFVENSVLFEHVCVGAHAIVRGSAVGPNTRLSGSEVNDSLLGPSIMAIHHGLILAAFWPEGKGNIAYGANVGSNHTGRAPDQEIWPGEGTFFGLGCNIKFPSNFREAPHSIIATGVNALPQKVSFPFSLICPPSVSRADVSPAFNEIAPGWGLHHNAYGIERHEHNLRVRNQARRMRIVTETFTPSLVGLMRTALARLDLAPERIRDFYTEREIPGLGKNLMTEPQRCEAMEAYRFGIELAGARALLQLLSADPPDRIDHRRIAWAAGLLGTSEPRELLDAALNPQRRWVSLIFESKARDDQRGGVILDDYAECHVAADQDPVVLRARENLAWLEARADRLENLLRELATPASRR